MNIKILLLSFLLISISSIKSQMVQADVLQSSYVVNHTSDYIITDYGCKPGSVCTKNIQEAIDDCHKAGGGRVIVPAGTFITGTLFLKSNVTLYLEEGAVLKGSENLNDYSGEGLARGIIYSEDAINVSIEGKGTIDGSGDVFYDFSENHLFDEFDKSRTRQKENYMPEGEYFTDGPVRRIQSPGHTIVFFHCSEISVKGIKVKDTPMYAFNMIYCDDIVIDGITIQNNVLIPNSDGIHCSTSSNIRISDCVISGGDDAIVLTGFTVDDVTPYNPEDQENYTYGNKTLYAENMTVDNCILKSSSSGIRVGYGQHPIRRCTFSNIIIHDSHRGIGVFAHDASNIEDLIFSNIIIETRLINGQWWGKGEPIHLSTISRFEGESSGQIKNVQFNHINAIGEQGILIYGQEESMIENISFNNVQLRMRKGKETLSYGGNFDLRPAAPKAMQLFEHDIPGLYAQFVANLFIRDFQILWGSDLPDFFTHGLEFNNVSGLSLNHIRGEGNPNSPGSQQLKLSNSELTDE